MAAQASGGAGIRLRHGAGSAQAPAGSGLGHGWILPRRAGPERPFVAAARASRPHSYPVRFPARGRSVTPIPFVMGATFRVAGPIHEAAFLSPVCGRSHACPPGVHGRERPS